MLHSVHQVCYASAVARADRNGAILEVRGAVKRYPGVEALRGVDFTIRPGEIVGLVGKNGAGKSSLIKILAGVEHLDEGTLTIDGTPVPGGYAPHIAHRLGLSFVHQELGNFPLLTVAENVAIGTRFPRRLVTFVNDRELRRQVQAVLDQLESGIDPGAQLEQLTTVEQRLVMIARALYHDARVLVLDEPSVSLSIDEIAHLHSIVRRFKELGRSVVYVSHRLHEVVALTDRVVVMQGGEVILEQPTSAIDERALVTAIAGDTPIPARDLAPAAGRGAAPPLLRVRSLSRPPAVRGVSLELHAGEILGLAGLVGSGRTELIRLIFGADVPTAGSIEVDGRPVRLRSPVDAIAHGIALLPEDRRHEGLVLGFSTRENITLASLPQLRSHRLLPVPSRAKERAVAADMVERLSIETPGLEQEARRLSGGNQQKVVLAKWLQRPDRVLLFDEPSQGIDVGAKAEIFGLIERLAAEGRGIILISSDFAELAEVCTRVIGLREGRVTGVVEAPGITETELVRLAYAPHGDAEDAVLAAIEGLP
jgi:ABC-type sugar transport system ATPase subunit